MPATFSVRQATWLLLRRPEELDEPEQHFVQEVCRGCVAAEEAYRLAQESFSLVRTRSAAALASWAARAEGCDAPELRGFVAGLRRDWPAVLATVTSSWSNGQTEGHVNRLKSLKRQMYGRAGFVLLRLRFPHPV